MIFTEKRVGRKEILRGRVFDAYVDDVELINGKRVTREYIEHNGGVAIVALTEQDELFLVRQYRYGAGKEMLELPAGKIDKGEEPYHCGMRELEEEIGYTAEKLSLITEMVSTPGFCSEKITIYYAEHIRKGTQKLDEDEFLSVEQIPFNHAIEMCLDGTITDAKTQVGILTYAMQKGR